MTFNNTPDSNDSGKKRGRGGERGPGDSRRGPNPEAKVEGAVDWQEKVIQIRRVTKVVKGGKKLSFRAIVIVGNGEGMVGMGIGKSNEVVGAIQKAIAAAKKNLITVPIHKQTIPHAVTSKAGSSIVVLRPASAGTGVIAGGAARSVFELAGVENILSKSLGSNSPLNVARAALKGLAELRTFQDIADARGLSVKAMIM
jgi:small subunit ribosomal protein S5